jgi:quercetin dioxygenase-like cupin family protein
LKANFKINYMNFTLEKPVVMKNRVYENPVFGDKATFLKTAAETNGEYTQIRIELAPGGGNTLHAHEEFTETFTAGEGSLTVQLGRKQHVLQPGESLTVPLRTPHFFKNPSPQPITFLVELRPGHAGFERAVQIAYGLAKDGLTNKKGIPSRFAHLALLATSSGSYPVGIYSLMMPLFRWAAKRARARGVEKDLVEKYCR